MISFTCTQCGEGLEAPESMQGERLQCPKCRYPETVPPPEEEPESIKLDLEESPDDTTQIRTFGSATVDRKKDYGRPLNVTGKGATRMRTFHTRLSNNAMAFLDEQVNEWIDENPDVEVKFSTSTVGMVEGKKTEPHLIVNVWY